jgi:hypothetical protein
MLLRKSSISGNLLSETWITSCLWPFLAPEAIFMTKGKYSISQGEKQG